MSIATATLPVALTNGFVVADVCKAVADGTAGIRRQTGRVERRLIAVFVYFGRF